MLLRLTVQNYLSIRDECELSFIAAPYKEHTDQLIHTRFAKHGLLPVVALYGANASGKSNMLYALAEFKRLVMTSFEGGQDRTGMKHKPFLLDEDGKHKPTTFILDFVMKDVRYQFGISHNDERVQEEWLFAFPKQIKQVLYSRNINEPSEFFFGRSLAGSNKQIQSITRPNSLFLSAAATSGHPLLSEIANFFKSGISIRLSSSPETPQKLAKIMQGDQELIQEVKRYLAMADTGIADIQIRKIDIPESEKGELREFMAAPQKMVGRKGRAEPDPGDAIYSLELGHKAKDGTVRFLDFTDESFGTLHLTSILPPVLLALRKGTAVILDEITTSLHTLLSRKLVAIFQDRSLNPHGAQLLFSTHDTNLLSIDVLRRDEIWFCEKASDGATSVYPLTEIKTKNTDNIERGYIQGRFGAVPFVEFT
jgi:AAA15 family ATPase/GTPase